MHIVLLFVSALIAAAYWYWRIATAIKVASHVGDMAGQIGGKVKRHLFRRKVEGSTLTGIDDPRLAACVLFVSFVEAGRHISSADEAAVATWLREVAGEEKPEEAVVFARWACREVVDVNEVIRRLLPLFKERLASAERTDLLDMVASLGNTPVQAPAQAEALRRLRHSLLPERASARPG